jgi:hypothetical protein
MEPRDGTVHSQSVLYLAIYGSLVEVSGILFAFRVLD